MQLPTDRKVVNYATITRLARLARRRGKKIVFKSGCFDIVHIGHIAALNRAKRLGDILIVGIGSDTTVKKLKGRNRPIVPERYRARVLAALGCVDYVVILREPLRGRIDHAQLLRLVRPTYYLPTPGDSAMAEKRALAKAIGTKIRLIPSYSPLSSTKLAAALHRVG
ncbi:MAG: D-beta-D-heptose 7-phosphate kinase / D-beta-D-heptose 1-phosphate adenosyltransferase [Parcubacteria group bacterium Gr01-1014_31]|nr:MAG: D-beta-D-heptose 7-phosphate kinase / D-beta-D-heptose 1-phosphate adenosyltransferase [Parcubacteria group bacterium Gr01-1014_31]